MGGIYDTAASEHTARTLMRQGLSDEIISARTGLSLMHLLELRAAAAVEERRKAEERPAHGRA